MEESPPPSPAAQVTQLLREWQQGNPRAESDLATLIYGELRRLAVQRLRGERREHTLQPTALVHEAWLRLGDSHSDWQNRSHFLAMAAIAMRRVLVDHARQRDAAKRGLGAPRVSYDAELHDVPGPMPDDRLLALDAALTRLDALDRRLARVVELRYFAGLSVEETASALGIAKATVKREWAAARAWLYDALEGQAVDGA